MNKQKYLKLLKDPRWQKKRLEIFQRDNFQCTICGDKKETLHIHHKIYNGDNPPWESNDEDLLTVCADCHDLISNHGFEDYYSIAFKIRRGDNIIYFAITPWDLDIYSRENKEVVKYLGCISSKNLQEILNQIIKLGDQYEERTITTNKLPD